MDARVGGYRLAYVELPQVRCVCELFCRFSDRKRHRFSYALPLPLQRSDHDSFLELPHHPFSTVVPASGVQPYRHTGRTGQDSNYPSAAFIVHTTEDLI
jgi:hypothetical protein